MRGTRGQARLVPACILTAVDKLGAAALVGGHGVGGGGDGAADDDVIGTDRLRLGGGHDPFLVSPISIGEANAVGDGQETGAAAGVDLSASRGEQTTPSSPAFFAFSA